jgi:hypothetical protein
MLKKLINNFKFEVENNNLEKLPGYYTVNCKYELLSLNFPHTTKSVLNMNDDEVDA